MASEEDYDLAAALAAQAALTASRQPPANRPAGPRPPPFRTHRRSNATLGGTPSIAPATTLSTSVGKQPAFTESVVKSTLRVHNMPDKVPQPGPAKLTGSSNPDEWLQCALRNQYLPEFIMKKLCEICKEYLMEGNNHSHLTSGACD